MGEQASTYECNSSEQLDRQRIALLADASAPPGENRAEPEAQAHAQFRCVTCSSYDTLSLHIRNT